jgi:hypothetical protein
MKGAIMMAFLNDIMNMGVVGLLTLIFVIAAALAIAIVGIMEAHEDAHIDTHRF